MKSQTVQQVPCELYQWSGWCKCELHLCKGPSQWIAMDKITTEWCWHSWCKVGGCWWTCMWHSTAGAHCNVTERHEGGIQEKAEQRDNTWMNGWIFWYLLILDIVYCTRSSSNMYTRGRLYGNCSTGPCLVLYAHCWLYNLFPILGSKMNY